MFLWKTYFVCVWGCLQEGITKKRRCTLNVSDTIPWTEIPAWTKRKLGKHWSFSLFSYLKHYVLNLLYTITVFTSFLFLLSHLLLCHLHTLFQIHDLFCNCFTHACACACLPLTFLHVLMLCLGPPTRDGITCQWAYSWRKLILPPPEAIDCL